MHLEEYPDSDISVESDLITDVRRNNFQQHLFVINFVWQIK